MTVAGDDPREGNEFAYTELIPRPDPSKLTDEAISRATVQFRRELDALRQLLAERIETLSGKHDHDVVQLRDTWVTATGALQHLLEARIDSIEAATDRRFEQVVAASVEHAIARDKAVGSLRELLEEQMGAVNRAAELLAADVRQVPSIVKGEISAQGELTEAKLAAMEQAVVLQNKQAAMFPVEIRTEISHLRSLHEEKFASIAQQFTERDIRTDQASRAAKEALDAALQAAKELVGAQGEAAGAAAIKSETSFTKQIDQIGTIISTLEKALDARITELKERIDRGEPATAAAALTVSSDRSDATYSQAAAAASGAQVRATISTAVAFVALLVAVVSVVVLISHGG
jgi:hypothetical protein